MVQLLPGIFQVRRIGRRTGRLHGQLLPYVLHCESVDTEARHLRAYSWLRTDSGNPLRARRVKVGRILTFPRLFARRFSLADGSALLCGAFDSGVGAARHRSAIASFLATESERDAHSYRSISLAGAASCNDCKRALYAHASGSHCLSSVLSAWEVARWCA